MSALTPIPARVARRRTALARAAALLAATAVLAAAVPGAIAHGNPSGFLTDQPPMLTVLANGGSAMPILTVGERLPGGYRFEAIPDGIAVRARGQGRVDLYINHETSTVPFPYTPGAPTEANSQNDFDNAQLSRVSLNQHSGGVLSARMVIRSEENWQRFCSNFLATAEQGFDREILFTNEEATDTVNRTGIAWPTTAGGADPQQAGVVVAYDVRTGKHRPILGMGRHNHENSVAVPGLSRLAIFSGDDTFVSNPPNSQLYVYMAVNADAVWNDQGKLYAFKPDSAATDDYYDVSGAATVAGTFIEVPKVVAQGDQTALETWSQANGVFDFVRIEDIAYDRNDPHILYLADSGRGSGAAPNGRVWKLVLSESAGVLHGTLSILINGDTSPVGTVGVIHQPDNLETTANSLLIQEDPSSGNQYPIGTGTTARIWRYDVSGSDAGTLAVVAQIDQSADEGSTDVDAGPAAKWGAWESSGIVDASAAFGAGAFFVTVQAHSLWVEKAPGPDYASPAGPDFTLKREGGQLLLIRIPGA